MRILVGIVSVGLILLMLAEFFVTFLLPRRMRRDPRIARQFFSVVWRPWRAIASRLSRVGADTMLGFFGPLGLLFVLAFLSAGVIVGFAGLHWAERSHLGGASTTDFGTDLYFSAGSFFTASTTVGPAGGFARVLQITEAASGFAVLFFSIAYAPRRSVGAEMTFAVGRHALADLARSFQARVPSDPPERLSDADLEELISRLEDGGLDLVEDGAAREKLAKLCSSYEKYAVAIAERLALALPGWLPGEDAVEYWRLAGAHGSRGAPHA